jgi:hypothetical protein
MGLVSQERIDAVTKVLETGDFNRKMNVLRQQPINPPDGANAMALTTPVAADTYFVKKKISKVEDMVGFIKLGAIERDQVGAMTFVVKLASELQKTAQRAGWIPCWFLPWQSGFIFKLKITSAISHPVLNFGPGSNIDPMPNPGLFFTAGINGCSVFSIGDAKSPSVYHGGITPGDLTMPLQGNETTEEAWRRLLGRANTTKVVGSVGKTDYINELNPGHTSNADRVKSKGFQSTQRAADFERLLDQNGTLTNVSVSPWGAVFGLRDNAGDWHMNLVKNATLTYHRLIQTTTSTTKKTLFGKKTVTNTVTAPRGEVRPQGFHPKTAHGLPDLSQPVQNYTEQCISTVVNLGHQEFFPGQGAAVYRDFARIQVY